MNISGYPNVYAIGHRALRDVLFIGPVVVEEKVDGSQFSFGVFDGELVCRSKGQRIDTDSPDKLFELGVQEVFSLRDQLHPGWIYRGEYLQKPKHNTLAYSRVPKHYVILFDIAIAVEDYLPWEEKKKEADKLGFDCVPLLWSGEIGDVETLKSFLEKESILGGVKIEGFVVKNYNQFTLDKKVAIGKYVTEAFKEANRIDFKGRNPSGKDVIETIGESLRTEARWQKAVQHLVEKGQLLGEPKDIALLFKEVPADILKEEEDAIKESLFKHAWPRLHRISTAGLAEWYKQKLLESAFSFSGREEDLGEGSVK